MEQVDQRDGIAFAPDDIADEVVAPSLDVEEQMDKVVIEEFNPTSLVVNGIGLTQESGLAALRAACSFHALSTSGSKKICFGRLLTYMKQVGLETAREALQAAERLHHRDPRPAQARICRCF